MAVYVCVPGINMDKENIYERLEDIFGHFPENISILEEQIDIDLQMEYFEYSRDLKKKSGPADLNNLSQNLFDKKYPVAEKKHLLVQLAASEEVSAYRIIEKYLDNPDAGLTDWAVLAFQESRMLLQSKLLDEDQVFISTGLGGKGAKLRYFAVFINSMGKPFSELQQKLIRTEFDYHLPKYDAEPEEVCFMDDYCSVLAVIPFRAPIRDLFRQVVDECNQYGGFLKESFIVTNVKKLSYEEINDYVARQDNIEDDGTP